MRKAIIVRGTLVDSTHIKLDEAVSGDFDVEVVLREKSKAKIVPDETESVVAIVDRSALEAALAQQGEAFEVIAVKASGEDVESPVAFLRRGSREPPQGD